MVGDGVTLVNPAYETAKELGRVLDENNLRAEGAVPVYRFFVSDSVKKFSNFAESILPCDVGHVECVNMEQYNIDKFNNILLANDQIVFCVNDSHRLAKKEVVTTSEMAKESLIFFNGDSVQNQLLKQRFELEGYTPNIIMRGSQIYTTLQFLKMNKYGCFLYSSMTDKFSSSNITGIPLNPPVRIKIGMVWKKSKYISGDMLTFLHFTRMYYKEHPLIEK